MSSHSSNGQHKAPLADTPQVLFSLSVHAAAVATLKMCSRRVAFSLLCLALVAALMTQEAEASKLKKVAKYALIGAALAPRIVPIPIPIG